MKRLLSGYRADHGCPYNPFFPEKFWKKNQKLQQLRCGIIICAKVSLKTLKPETKMKRNQGCAINYC